MSEKVDVSKMNMKTIKQTAKDLGLKNYSSLVKNEIMGLILTESDKYFDSSGTASCKLPEVKQPVKKVEPYELIFLDGCEKDKLIEAMKKLGFDYGKHYQLDCVEEVSKPKIVTRKLGQAVEYEVDDEDEIKKLKELKVNKPKKDKKTKKQKVEKVDKPVVDTQHVELVEELKK
tara:strand:+ start:750 stop:1271 length:522 start_codon:yes stop_codon:yes gene_type:complete